MERSVPIWAVIVGSSLRYLLFAGMAYGLFYGWKRKSWSYMKIQPRFPKPAAVRTELRYSVSTMVIFGVVIWAVLFSPLRRYTRLYYDIHLHSRLYVAASVLIAIFIHDTYFYWTHRLMHWKKIFPYVHHIHHRSHNPTPLAAFSFHPLEALVEVGVLPVIVCTIPIHRRAVAIFGLYMILMNVIGHLGYELYGAGFMQKKWLRWLNTSTHHNMHHHYGKHNYGLYFNIWDTLMKTNHRRYREEFTVAAKKKRTKSYVIAQQAVVSR